MAKFINANNLIFTVQRNRKILSLFTSWLISADSNPPDEVRKPLAYQGGSACGFRASDHPNLYTCLYSLPVYLQGECQSNTEPNKYIPSMISAHPQNSGFVPLSPGTVSGSRFLSVTDIEVHAAHAQIYGWSVGELWRSHYLWMTGPTWNTSANDHMESPPFKNVTVALSSVIVFRSIGHSYIHGDAAVRN